MKDTTRKNKRYINRSNKSSNTFKGEREMTRKLKILTGEVHSQVQPTYIATDNQKSQYVNFVFKEMEYQPYGTTDFANGSPINMYTQAVLDTAISSTTRNSTSVRAINTWKQRYGYLDQVAKGYAFYCSLDQFINYYYEPRSMNFGVNNCGRVCLDADVLNAHKRLGIALTSHSMPMTMQQACQNIFKWRQTGDSAESAVMGLTTLTMSNITSASTLLSQVMSMALAIEELTAQDSTNDYVAANIQTSLNKQGMDWAIRLPEYSGILAYEKEYLTLFLHSATSRGSVTFPSNSDTYSFIEGELTPFTCVHIMDPQWRVDGILKSRLNTGSSFNTSYIVSKNTGAGFDQIQVGNSDIAKKLIGLPTFNLQTNASGGLQAPVINQIPGGKLVRGITTSQPDTIQEYLYDMYEIPKLQKNFPKDR